MNNKIFSLIPKIMDDVGAIAKTRKMAEQAGGYAFRGIEDLYYAVQPAFIKHGVFCAPEVIDAQNTQYETTNRNGEKKLNFRTLLRVKHFFFADDGSSVSVTTQGEGVDSGDKASNKAMSQAMKYAFIELLSVPTRDIEDPDRLNREESNVQNLQAKLAAPVQPRQPNPAYKPDPRRGPSQPPGAFSPPLPRKPDTRPEPSYNPNFDEGVEDPRNSVK